MLPSFSAVCKAWCCANPDLPLPIQWYGDCPHLARTGRRNCHNWRVDLLFTDTLIGGVSRLRTASLAALQRIADSISLEKGYRLKDILQVNTWRDQKTDAAYFLFSTKTIRLLEQHAPEDEATMLFMWGMYFILEPFLNKQFTNPAQIVQSVWIAVGIFTLQEIYVKKCCKNLDKDSDCYLPSYQFRRTVKAMAHAATNHVLMFHRHRRGKPWSRLGLANCNQNPLEGLHSDGRCGSVLHNNDRNYTVKRWLEVIFRLMVISEKKMKVNSTDSWSCGEARNAEGSQSGKIKTLGSMSEYASNGGLLQELQRLLAAPLGASSTEAAVVTAQWVAQWHTAAEIYNCTAVSSQPAPVQSTTVASSQPAPVQSTTAVSSQPAPVQSTTAVSSQPAPVQSTTAVSSQPAPAPSKPEVVSNKAAFQPAAPKIDGFTYEPKAKYDHFVQDMKGYKSWGQTISMWLWRRINPVAVAQMEASGHWPEKVVDGKLVVSWPAAKHCANLQSHIVAGSACLTIGPADCMDPDDLEVPASTKKDMDKAQEALQKELCELQQDDVDGEMGGCATLVGGASVEAINGVLLNAVEDNKLDTDLLLAGKKLQSNGMKMEHGDECVFTDSLLAAEQDKEKVSSDRWKRFIVSVLRSRGGFLKPNHDTTRGTVVIIRGIFGSPKQGREYYAVGRVLKMCEDNAEAFSVELKGPSSSTAQTFKCELMYPVGDPTPAGDKPTLYQLLEHSHADYPNTTTAVSTQSTPIPSTAAICIEPIYSNADQGV